jgi:hypothetical protein
MSSKNTERFELEFGRVGRVFGGSEELMDAADVAAWEAAADLFKVASYQTSWADITLTFDWSPMVENVRAVQRADLKSLEGNDSQYPDRKVSVDCLVETRPRGRKKNPHSPMSEDFITYFLNEIFLLVNLSSPGGLECSDTGITGPNSGQLKILHASSFLFENAWHESLGKGWPEISAIPLESVFQWIKGLNLGLRQLATSRVEKALFGLLHLAEMSFLEPTAIIWLAQSLESLYDVPAVMLPIYQAARNGGPWLL